MVDRTYPHDIDAEEAVLGSLVIDGSAFQKINNLINVSDFYSERNGFVFGACVNLFNRREQIDQITLAQELSRLDKLESIGGAAFLSHCVGVVPTSLDIEMYAQIVYRLSVSRKLISTSEKLANIGLQALPDATQTVNQSAELFNNFQNSIITLGSKVITPIMAANALIEMINDYGKPNHAISWGFVDLDQITTGIHPELIIIGARPGVGKTQIMLDIAENIDTQGKKQLFVTSEMTLKQLLERKVARTLGVDIGHLRQNGLVGDQDGKVVDLAAQVSQGGLHYLSGKVYSHEIYLEAQKLMRTVGLDIIFIDYLQFLADCWEETRENQNVRVGKACKTLKSLVDELKIPVVVASQLNRSLEFRGKESRTPTLADLRDSGNIEQDADVVFLLFREPLDDYRLSNVLQIKMAKNRQLGEAEHIQLNWHKQLHRYVNMSYAEVEYGEKSLPIPENCNLPIL